MTQENTSANLLKHSDIFPVRRKAAEGLKTKGSKLPNFTKRLPIAVQTIFISAPYLLLEDTIPSASRI